VFTDWPINPRASIVSNLYAVDLVGAQSWNVVITRFLEWTQTLSVSKQDRMYLIAYNGFRFDFPLFVNDAVRCGFPESVLHQFILVDPLKWIRSNRTVQYNAKSLRLSDLHLKLTGSSIIRAHDALADAKALSVVCAYPVFSNMLTSAGTHIRQKSESAVHIIDIGLQESEQPRKRTKRQTVHLLSTDNC
jgi:hypothetical protein